MKLHQMLFMWAFSICLITFGQSTIDKKTPHELKDFYKNLQTDFSTLESGLTQKNNSTSMADKFLKMIISNYKILGVDKRKSFKELDLTPELKAKLLSLINEANKNNENDEAPNKNTEILFSDLEKIAAEFSSNLSDEEKIQIAGLLLVHTENKILNKDVNTAIESLIQKYQKDPLLKETKKTDKKGLDLLSQIIASSLANPESLDSLLNPIKEQIYNSGLAKLPSTTQLSVPKFSEVLNIIKPFAVQPQPPNFSNGSIAPRLNPFSGGGVGGSCNSGGRFGVPNSRTIPRGGLSPIPASEDTEALKACTDGIRGKRFNVELGLPGALCASTPIAKDPDETMKSFRKDPQASCEVHLASALHCIEGKGDLTGRTITTSIGRAKITQVSSPDTIRGQSVQDGNPDLILLTVEIPCGAALSLNIARVPTPIEITEFTQNSSLPLVLQQNASINASSQGSNQATIAATGTFDRTSNGELGNFIRFNTNSSFNSSSGVDRGPLTRSPGLVSDSDRIKSGDSGGAALTCKLDDKKVKEVLFMGAISHILVRNDNDEGKEGGIASGQSLLNLSRAFWGDERNGSGSRFAGTTRTNNAH